MEHITRGRRNTEDMTSLIPKAQSGPEPAVSTSYEPIKALGEGGQGFVWLWRNTATQELVAAKSAHRKEDEQDLLHESMILRKVQHVQGVVPFKGACLLPHGHRLRHRRSIPGKHRKSYLHILFRYCEGGTLRNFLFTQKDFKLSEKLTATICRQLVKTLRGCHGAGIMHRDIKLENVLLSCKSKTYLNMSDINCINIDPEQDDGLVKGKFYSNCSRKRKVVDPSCGKADTDAEGGIKGPNDLGNVFLGDFGLACNVPSPGNGKLSEIAGTSLYMAPEVIQGCYDHRADIWSLGVLLHVMLTGHFPFGYVSDITHVGAVYVQQRTVGVDERDEQTLFNHILTIELNPDDTRYSHLSFYAKWLLLAMLEKDPSCRITLEQLYRHRFMIQASDVPPIKKIRIKLPKQSTPGVCDQPVRRIRFKLSSGRYVVRDLMDNDAITKDSSCNNKPTLKDFTHLSQTDISDAQPIKRNCIQMSSRQNLVVRNLMIKDATLPKETIPQPQPDRPIRRILRFKLFSGHYLIRSYIQKHDDCNEDRPLINQPALQVAVV